MAILECFRNTSDMQKTFSNLTPFLRSKNGLLLGQTGGHLPFNTVPKFVSNSLLGGGMMPAAANGMLGGGMMGGTMGARTMGGIMGAGMMGGMLGGMMPGAAGPMLPVPGLASNSGGMRTVVGFVHTRH